MSKFKVTGRKCYFLCWKNEFQQNGKKTNFHWKKVSNSSCVENGRRNDKLKLLVFTLRSFEGFVLQRVFCFPVFS